ncbi:MAG TPA: PA0069 family radical SAM protein [Parvularculaceae bacterium]|nr:PA0069 family radical SAM protein [Parvularculaceae bacterium]HNS85431.1 PA0069 family radical SAM protein [Parvularculaceae bacterium]
MTRAAGPSPASRRPTEAGPPAPAKGRGARSNVSGRYEKLARESVDDGWDAEPDPAQKTEVTLEAPKTIINYISSPFVGFDRSINPYRGCEHGCVYCFARPSHAYYGLSAGLDFETKIFAKPNAAVLLDRELASKHYKPRHIAIGTNTDPYQPVERKHRLMRGLLSTLAKYNHPVSILTKSALIERDIDLLSAMAEAKIVKTMLSVTTLDPKLARAMEPRASTPAKRLGAIRALKTAGVPVGVMTAPMIPGLNDHELEDLLEAAREAGAEWAGYTIIRIPLEIAGLFREWLQAERPDRADRVMRHIRDMNGGRDYDVEWARAKSPRSVVAKLIRQRFEKTVRRLNFPTDSPPLDPASFRRPEETVSQLSLF